MNGRKSCAGVEWVASKWISVTTVEGNICVTYFTSINFISDYHMICVNHSVLYYTGMVGYLQINRVKINAAKDMHILS